MRVIAGRLGGRRLQAPRGRDTRPTSDRVREALFAMLGDIEGLRVLDLFAGTGALGIEALSRGAASVLFVERDRAALAVLRANLDSLSLGRDVARVRRGDVPRVLRAARAEAETYDLVFIDPPYREAPRWAAQLSSLLPALLAPGALVAAESDRRAPLELALEPWRARCYGDTAISIHRQP